MRKRINLVLVICLVALIACFFAACNKDGAEYVDRVPEELGLGIDPGTGDPTTDIDGGSAVMEYSFTKEVSSILHSIIIDPEDGFDISTVNYSIIYRKGAQVIVTNEKPLSLEYVDEADRPLLKQPGFHTIHTSVPYGNGIVKGSFTMRLKYEYQEVEYVDLTFNVDGGIPHFATATNNIVKTSVEKGLSFSYDEFIRYFTITKDGQAIKDFAVEGNAVKTLSRTAPATGSGTSSSITITGKTTFTVHWTANVVSVNFEINAPKGATAIGEIPTIQTQSVEQSVGTVMRPAIDMNLFNGYFFAGWYDKSNDRAWNFTNPAGQKNITLYAKWTIRYYETTIYPMSSTFKADIKNSVSAKGAKKELKSIDDAKADGYIITTCDVTFNAATNNVLSVNISGLTYGRPYSDYAAEVRVKNTNNAEDKRILILSELFESFEKLTPDETLNKQIVTGGVFYSTQACKDEDIVEVEENILGNKVLYIKWSLDLEGLSADVRKSVLSSFYTNVLYKDSYEIKSDGSVKLIDIKDETFCDIIVPDSITIAGTDRYITEFASKAAMNVRSLGKLDLSEASHLTSIGSEAFINCSNLYEIVWPQPQDNHIENIGKKAFKNTSFENDYPTDFIVINDILYKFLDKEGNAREVDMTTCAESEELLSVKKVADNAFADALLLEKVTLS
ncbi:MAG: leucine-rich repeat protein, partial [Clostridia bacterium]|nr:leucine-rich repeat protein [Clostridia bacterium]